VSNAHGIGSRDRGQQGGRVFAQLTARVAVCGLLYDESPKGRARNRINTLKLQTFRGAQNRGKERHDVNARRQPSDELFQAVVQQQHGKTVHERPCDYHLSGLSERQRRLHGFIANRSHRACEHIERYRRQGVRAPPNGLAWPARRRAAA
jgi:hypothetical protein